MMLGLAGCMEQEYQLLSMVGPAAGALPELLDSLGGVRGRVCAPSGSTWVAGATVWVTLEDGTVVHTKTDGDGWYNLADVPPGKYTVHVKKGSFNTTFSSLDCERCLDYLGVRDVPDVECVGGGRDGGVRSCRIRT